MPDQALTFRVDGVPKLTRTLKKAGEDITELVEAHARAAAIVEAAARATAPRRSGKLASSIRATRSKLKAEIQVRSIYAMPIHWGWPSRNIDPQPWVSQAAQATEPEWLPIYEDAVQKALDQVAGA